MTPGSHLWLSAKVATQTGKSVDAARFESFLSLVKIPDGRRTVERKFLSMSDRSSIMARMNQLTTEKRVRVVAALVEGNSIRATVRMTGVAKATVMKLLVDLGHACDVYQRSALVNLRCKRLQVDEIWSFCYAKQKNIPPHLQGMEGIGDVWTWTAIDADTKLVPCWLIGGRDAGYAHEFIRDLASRLASQVQLTSDGHGAYLQAVEDAFGDDIDYAQLIKLYGTERESEARYSPAKCIGVRSHTVTGDPEGKHISTSYVERQNLTMRMSMRRFTRLTNAHSKKFANHAAAVALHFMYYNFGRIHSTLRITPAMAASVSDHVWEIEEIVGLLNQKPEIEAA